MKPLLANRVGFSPRYKRFRNRIDRSRTFLQQQTTLAQKGPLSAHAAMADSLQELNRFHAVQAPFDVCFLFSACKDTPIPSELRMQVIACAAFNTSFAKFSEFLDNLTAAAA
jgi:hypothetical protein